MLVIERGWHAQPVLVPLRKGLALVGILDGDWAAADTISRLSVSAAQKTAADTWVTSAPVLAGAGSIGEAKAAYVKSVSALESWCKLTGYDKVVQGL